MKQTELIRNKKRSIAVGPFLAAAALAFAADTAQAGGLGPVPIGAPLSGDGDGLCVLWVGTGGIGDSPDTTAEALTLLGNLSAPFRLEEIRPGVDLQDGNVSGAGADNTPAGIGDAFAVVLTGYLNVTEAGLYTFSAYHDDGFRFSLGGVTVMEFATNTPPATTAANIVLSEGLYEFEYLGWEQGGLFVQELSWKAPSSSSLEIIPTKNLFKKPFGNPVPENGSTLAFLGLSLMGLSLARRKSAFGAC